ncbi:MAG: hypothetical protein JW863_08725 [Chitinispirillaceae bacterium]|nr:hypothetical protein [Chitinispirillaceae bacterium]
MMLRSLIVLTVAMSTLLFNVSPAVAADGITPYASLTLWTNWAHRSAELGEAIVLVAELEKGYRDRIDYQTDLTATGSSFIGITGEKNNLSMKAEIGVYPFTTKGTPTVSIRYFYGAYKFGAFELRGGYDLAPYTAINRDDVCDGEAFADAALFESFQPQLRLSAWGAYFQIMRSVVNNEAFYLDSGLIGVPVATVTSNTETVIPKMALGYVYTASKFSLGVHGVYQSYSIDEPSSKNDGESVNALVGSVAMTGNFGPLSLYISGFAGQNPGELGIFTNNNKNGSYIPFHPAANNKAQMDTAFNMCNTVGYGFSASGGCKIGILQINAGFAYDCDHNKVFKRLPQWPSDKDDSYAFFADMIFSITQNVRLVPTIKVINYLNSSGNVFQSYDSNGNILPQKVKEGVLTRFGFAFQASI